MIDLFGDAPISGLRTTDDLVDAGTERALIERIDAAGLSPFEFGAFTGKRLTRSFGQHYDFTAHRLVEADAIPDWLLPVRSVAAGFAGLAADDLRHCLLIRYDPGAGIGWHKDRPAFDKVIGLSLGSPAQLQFRRRRTDGGFDRARLPLPPRSAYLLDGEARRGWEHGIPSHASLRYSITFRSVAVPGR